MTITAILCDLDGTLVDSRQDIAVAFQHAWRAVVGGSPPSATAIAAKSAQLLYSCRAWRACIAYTGCRRAPHSPAGYMRYNKKVSWQAEG
jgi:hypothetical protein